MLNGAKAFKSCRSRQQVSNEYLLAKFGVDTAENEPLKVRQKLAKSQNRSQKKTQRHALEFAVGRRVAFPYLSAQLARGLGVCALERFEFVVVFEAVVAAGNATVTWVTKKDAG